MGLSSWPTSTDLKFSPATAADNGVYTYKITNRGCVDTGSVAKQHALSVKPYIKFTAQDEYVARRTVSCHSTRYHGSCYGDLPLSTGRKMEYHCFNQSIVTSGKARLCTECQTFRSLITVRHKEQSRCWRMPVCSCRLIWMARCASDTRDLIIDTVGTGSFVYPDKARADRSWNGGRCG